MARGLAFVQLLIVCFGVFALHLLVKLDHPGNSAGFIPSLAYFLGRYALWFIPLPILWAIFGNMLMARFGKKITHVVGLVLTLVLFVMFAVPLFWYLS